MKTFDQFLVEGQKTRIEALITYGVYLPLSGGLAKKHNLPQSITAFHATSPDGLKNLVELQHSNHHISASVRPAPYILFKGGFETGGGVYTRLEGKPLAKGNIDIDTYYDDDGQRWINLERYRIELDRSGQPNAAKAVQAVSEAISNWRDGIIKSLDPLCGDWDAIVDKYVIRVGESGDKEKRAAITSLADKYFRLYKQFLRTVDLKPVLHPELPDSEMMDETVLTHFSIKAVIAQKKFKSALTGVNLPIQFVQFNEAGRKAWADFVGGK